jgi:hypothetical protein
MRRVIYAAVVGLFVVAIGPVAAYAQSGHFIEQGGNAPACTDIGTQVRCTGKVAGLGGTTFEITIEASGVATVQCRNPGGNIAPGQDTSVDAAGSSGPQPTPRNGQFQFSITTVPPVVPNVPTCPNPGWTAIVTDVEFGDATLSLFEDGVLSDQITVPVS